MGANAQTTVPTFTAGQVLTADQQNQSARTGVPVFAGTTERDAAFGGAGEKTLAEGQLCYLESTNVVQYYDGAAWATVGPQTLSSGLNYITGATFTTATSVSLPNSTFTSTNANYRFVLSLTAVTADSDFTLRLRASGSDDTTSNYDTVFLGLNNAGTASNSTQGAGSSILVGESDVNFGDLYTLVIDVLRPQLSVPTNVYGTYYFLDKGLLARYMRVGIGSFRNTTAFDSLSFISSTASSLSGNYRVYGYANS